MKLLHTSDWHVGKVLKGRNRLEEQRAVLAEIVTLAKQLRAVRRREDGRLDVVLHDEYADLEVHRVVDQVVIEHGTVANDDLYHSLVPGSTNLGAVDQGALLRLAPQAVRANPAGRDQLFRIGDAVAGRTVHAAIHDALRLAAAT